MQNKESVSYKWLKWLAGVIVLCGIVLRLVVYFQDRNLMLDEANVARNIFERGFTALVKPLSYEQYAPPIFLWILKISSVVFGFSELALRVYPLLTGILAFLFLIKILQRLSGYKAMWYPLLLFAISPILIRYTSELKQYMPDVCIALALLYLALKVSVASRPLRFLLIWFIAGSLAIWASMPSVFILAGVGCYYGIDCLQRKTYRQLAVIITTSVLWLLQFAIYYFAILKPQIGSDYLQNFHQYDFLFATPANGGEWMHNWSVYTHLIRQFADNEFFVFFNTALIIIGLIALFRRSLAFGSLLFVPLLALMIAAALNQFSLMPRVALFSLPLFLIAIAAGLQYTLSLGARALKIVILLPVLVCAVISIQYSCIEGCPYKYEQLTEGLSYMQQQHISGPYLYIHHASGPAFIYYTQIHPRKKMWQNEAQAEILPWTVNYDSLAWQMRYVWKNEKPVAFLYTNATAVEIRKRRGGLLHHFKEINKLEKPYIHCYIYDPKP